MKEIDKEIDNSGINEEEHFKSQSRKQEHIFLDSIVIFLTFFLTMVTLGVIFLNILKTSYGDFIIAMAVSSSLTSKCINFLQKQHILPKRNF
ncbi:MAG: hypothetical protein FD179_1782 [Erysipelotrichaceae bacterium]|nr:MAG: hypothetical protein FD179_1782 [Erysipelotrichaceae bacterium]